MINEFMGVRGMCRTLRRGSVVVLANDEQLSNQAKEGREASKAKELSNQFQNLGRGDSFAAKQFAKCLLQMDTEDFRIVESAALEEMTRLGYELHHVGKTHDRKDFTEELIHKYDELNKQMLSKMFLDLEKDNPADLCRRQRMASVLKKSRVHFRQSFAEMDLDRDEMILEDTDDEDEIEDHFDVKNIDVAKWPLKASQVGFPSRNEVAERLALEKDTRISFSENFSLRFAVSTQRGYYPSDRDKANQDAYINGQ